MFSPELILFFSMPYTNHIGVESQRLKKNQGRCRYEGQSISNASYFFFSFTFEENSNTIT